MEFKINAKEKHRWYNESIMRCNKQQWYIYVFIFKKKRALALIRGKSFWMPRINKKFLFFFFTFHPSTVLCKYLLTKCMQTKPFYIIYPSTDKKLISLILNFPSHYYYYSHVCDPHTPKKLCVYRIDKRSEKKIFYLLIRSMDESWEKDFASSSMINAWEMF
jgi:hypothetical protein